MKMPPVVTPTAFSLAKEGFRRRQSRPSCGYHDTAEHERPEGLTGAKIVAAGGLAA
jgi:hypothetical protein